jgi:lipoteichoic acid synthase
MRATCLLVVLIVAKLIVLAGVDVRLSAWAPIAYFWQDALVALAAAGLDALFRRPRGGWGIYALLVVYVALSVPVMVVLASPLTWAMIRAARGPLADSMTHYVTGATIAMVACVACVGAVIPVLIGRVGPRVPATAMITAAIVVALGPLAASHLDTVGLDRNPVTALFARGLPAVTASAAGDWRASPFPSSATEGLSVLKGSARGFNVVVVILESTAARYLRPYGATEDPMPTLTRLSERALLFENAYAAYPESIKGLFAALCSRYPAFDVPVEAYAAVPCASIAQVLRTHGYRTALFHSGRFAYLGMDQMIEHKGFDLLEDAGAIGGTVRSSFGVDEPATVARMLGWIDSFNSKQPFFLTYLPIAGHHPYATPEPGPFKPANDQAQYLNALHYADAALGLLVQGLRERHVDERTLMIVFGDHGEAFGQHPGNVGHTMFINDENVRVPYLVLVPGVTGAPGMPLRVSRVASVIDTAPTILDLLGLPSAAEHQGSSLLAPSARMALFFTDYSLGWLGLRDGCWKYQFEIDSGRSWLFDVCRDADETVDRSADQRARARAYRERVEQWSAAQRALVLARPARSR